MGHLMSGPLSRHPLTNATCRSSIRSHFVSEHVARTVWYKLHDGHSVFWSAAKSDGFPDVFTTPGHDRHYGSRHEASFQSVPYDWMLSRTDREARIVSRRFWILSCGQYILYAQNLEQLKKPMPKSSPSRFLPLLSLPHNSNNLTDKNNFY